MINGHPLFLVSQQYQQLTDRVAVCYEALQSNMHSIMTAN